MFLILYHFKVDKALVALFLANFIKKPPKQTPCPPSPSKPSPFVLPQAS